MNNDEVIIVKDLSFSRGSINVLSGISFSVSRGDYLGIVGPNGSGKSTLIKLVLGLLVSDSGEIALFGDRPSEFNQWSRLGYLPQNLGPLNPSFPATVFEVVKLGLLSGKRFPRR